MLDASLGEDLQEEVVVLLSRFGQNKIDRIRPEADGTRSISMFLF